MLPYDSIKSGELPPITPELQRYADRVWERWQLRVIFVDCYIGSDQCSIRLYIDLKHGNNAEASKLLEAVKRNGDLGGNLNSVKRFGTEVNELADALTDEYFSVIGTDRETLCARLEPYIPTTPELAQLSGQFQQICTYIRLHRLRVGIYLRPLVGGAAGGDCREVPHTEPERRIRILRAGADRPSGRQGAVRGAAGTEGRGRI